MAASMGVSARVCTVAGSSPYTWDASAEPWEFLSDSVLKQDMLVNPPTIRGTRSPCYARTRLGPHIVRGSLHVPMSPNALNIWIPRAFGGTRSANVIGLAETIPAFGYLADRVADTFEYTNCYVDKLIIRGRRSSPGDPAFIDMMVQIIGTDETVGTSYPAVTLDCSSLAWQAMMFSDLVITLVGTVRPIMDFVFMIDNHLDVRYTNSLAPTSILPMDRTVALRTTNPFTSDESDLYQQAVSGSAGSLVFTNSTVSANFAFDKLQCTTKSPIVAGKQEIPLFLDFISRKGSNDEVKLTIDNTP